MIEMLGSAVQGYLSILNVGSLLCIMLGVSVGLVFGLLPGIGGGTAMVLLIPFIYGMEPSLALSVLLAAHAVAYTGGSVTAILMNIPGTPPNAATLVDGYPMTQKGLGGRALGNALTASGLGGIIGGVALIGLIFIVRPVVMAFGLPELFFLVVIGLAVISVLGRGAAVKGGISAIIGIYLSFVGVHSLTGQPRFTFGTIQLLEGVSMIPLLIGIFAMPEVITLFTSRGTILKVEKTAIRPGLVWQGIKDVFHHFRLFLLSSVLGIVVGMIPGIGGETAPFLGYGFAKQISKHPEEFGQGSVEGVIAPESANNAKEGGALLPTLAFGIPGSAGMAILLGLFLLVGLQPGPMFLVQHAEVAFALIGTLILSNLIGAGVLLALSERVSKLVFVRGTILAPLILFLVTTGSYSINKNPWDVVFLFVFGAFGVAMKAYGYNRPALFLGYILGSMGETYFGLSIQTYGPLFFFSPLPFSLLLIALFCAFFNPIMEASSRVKRRINAK